MKKIETIIRSIQFEAVRKALLQLGIEFFTYSELTGVGSEKRDSHFRGTEYETRIIPRISISFVCSDEIAQGAVDSILKAAHCKEQGDGKIYISTIDEIVNIKTKELKNNVTIKN